MTDKTQNTIAKILGIGMEVATAPLLPVVGLGVMVKNIGNPEQGVYQCGELLDAYKQILVRKPEDWDFAMWVKVLADGTHELRKQ